MQAAALSSALSSPWSSREFRTVYGEYSPFVRGIARRAGVAASALDDVCQEVFLVVFRLSPTLYSRGAFRSWLYRVAHNVIKTHQRTARRRSAFRGAAEEDPDQLPSNVPGPFEEARRSELVRHALGALGELSAQSREAFLLVDVLQMTGREAAAELSVLPNAMNGRVHRARLGLERIRRKLAASPAL